MKRLSFLPFTLLILLSFSRVTYAENVAQVVEIQGEVWRIRGKKRPQLLKANARLAPGDELITGPASSAKVLMEDDTVFDVYEGSQLHIKGYESKKSFNERSRVAKRKDPKAKLEKRQKIYRLSVGGIKGIFPTDKLRKKPIHLESPDSTIEISGTTLFTQVTSEKGEYTTSVLLTKGKAFIRPTISNQFKRRPIEPGQVFATDFASRLGHSLSVKKLAPADLKRFTTERRKESQKYRRSILSGKRKFVLSPQMRKFYRQNSSATAREKNFTRNKIKKVIQTSSNRAMNMSKRKKMKKFKNINKAPKCTTKPVCVQTGPVRVRNAQGNYVWVTKCTKFETKRFPSGCRP